MRTIVPKNAKLIPENAKQVFRGEIFAVYQWQQKMFDGSSETFEMLRRQDTIKIIAVKDQKIVVINEEQPHYKAYLGLPGGRHDVDAETELDAAKRELLEETGMSFKSWRLIEVKQPHGEIDWFIYLFLATDFENQIEQKLDTGEKIEVKLMDFDEFKELVNNPKARNLPKEVIESCQSLEDLVNLPEYKN